MPWTSTRPCWGFHQWLWDDHTAEDVSPTAEMHKDSYLTTMTMKLYIEEVPCILQLFPFKISACHIWLVADLRGQSLSNAAPLFFNRSETADKLRQETAGLLGWGDGLSQTLYSLHQNLQTGINNRRDLDKLPQFIQPNFWKTKKATAFVWSTSIWRLLEKAEPFYSQWCGEQLTFNPESNAVEEGSLCDPCAQVSDQWLNASIVGVLKLQEKSICQKTPHMHFKEIHINEETTLSNF